MTIIMDDLSHHTAESVPKPAPMASKAKIPVFHINYDGQHGAVFRLHLLNVLLNIVTLGIYSFWGKTRIRRYITSHISLANDQFEYTGTGKELFFGALKALIIFVPLAIAMNIPFVNLLALPVFLGVISLAIYLAMRYRLSRTRWRGIRFSLGGSIKEYLVLSIKRTLINIVTLGWKIPSSDIMKWSYIANHMQYGTVNFSYEGDASRLRKIHLITLGILVAVIMIPVIAGAVSGAQKIIQAKEHPQMVTQSLENGQVSTATSVENGDSYQSVSQEDLHKKHMKEEDIVLLVLAFYLALAIGIGARLWYHAALWHEKFRGLRLGDLRFKCDVTGKGLLKLHAVNILIILFSLGLAKPIALNRVARYYTRNIRIGGDINALTAKQSTASLKSGMGDALAADVGFDLGL